MTGGPRWERRPPVYPLRTRHEYNVQFAVNRILEYTSARSIIEFRPPSETCIIRIVIPIGFERFVSIAKCPVQAQLCDTYRAERGFMNRTRGEANNAVPGRVIVVRTISARSTLLYRSSRRPRQQWPGRIMAITNPRGEPFHASHSNSICGLTQSSMNPPTTTRQARLVGELIRVPMMLRRS